MPLLTDEQRDSVGRIYDLVWAMIQATSSTAFKGIIGNAFELMLRAAFTGTSHWRVTYISIRAAKAILRAAHATPKRRPTGLDRAHAIPTTDAAGEKVKHGPNKHLSRAARRRHVLEPENGIRLTLDELLRVWWENDEVTLVTHGEQTEAPPHSLQVFRTLQSQNCKALGPSRCRATEAARGTAPAGDAPVVGADAAAAALLAFAPLAAVKERMMRPWPQQVPCDRGSEPRATHRSWGHLRPIEKSRSFFEGSPLGVVLFQFRKL